MDAKEVLVIKNTSWSRSLAGQFLAFQLVVVAVVLVAVAAVSVAQSTSEFREVRGLRMIAVASVAVPAAPSPRPRQSGCTHTPWICPTAGDCDPTSALNTTWPRSKRAHARPAAISPATRRR